jgi:hypothetical protein
MAAADSGQVPPTGVIAPTAVIAAVVSVCGEDYAMSRPVGVLP